MAIDTTVETDGRATTRVFAAVFFLSPLIASIAPRVTPATMTLVAVALILAALRRGMSWKELIVPSAALLACLVFSLYVLTNASWARNPGAGYIKAFVLLGVVLLVFASATAARKLDEHQIRLAAAAFVAGAALGALYLLIEVTTDGAIFRFAMNTFQIRPDDTKRVVIVHDQVIGLALGALNQNVTLIMLHFWPGILMLMALARAQRRALLITLFVTISAAAILLSEHDSSQFALLGSALTLLIAWRWQRLAISNLAVVWCLAFAAVLPLSFAAYKADLHLSESLPLSYKARINIWEYTAERTLEHPWLGVGVRSTREKDNAHVAQKHPQDQPKGFVKRWRYTGHHGHSLFMQTWYELGAVGAVLLAIAGALVVLRTSTLPREAQPFAAATFASYAIIAAFAWGIWQTWWMCAAALAAIYLCLGASAASAATLRSSRSGGVS
jgi:MFS family permease